MKPVLVITRLRPKVITYRNYKKFHEKNFWNDLRETNIIIDKSDTNQNYQSLTFVNKNASLKRKMCDEIRPPLWQKNSKKQFTLELDWKTKWTKILPQKIKTTYKRRRNLCASLRRKNIKSFLNNLTKRGIIRNKNFWTFIKPFLTNKGFLEKIDITIVEGNKVITSERGKTFNE